MKKRMALLLVMLLALLLPVWAMADITLKCDGNTWTGDRFVLEAGKTYTMSGSTDEGVAIILEGDATLILDGVNITVEKEYALECRVTNQDGVYATLTVELKGENTIEVKDTPYDSGAQTYAWFVGYDSRYAGNHVALVIGGEGSLNAVSSAGAGIYVYDAQPYGSMTISGGTINTSGLWAMGDLVIEKATVTASSAYDSVLWSLSNIEICEGAWVKVESKGIMAIVAFEDLMIDSVNVEAGAYEGSVIGCYGDFISNKGYVLVGRDSESGPWSEGTSGSAKFARVVQGAKVTFTDGTNVEEVNAPVGLEWKLPDWDRLNLSAPSGYRFSGWKTDDGSFIEAGGAVTITKTATFTAVFVEAPKVEADSSGGGSSSGGMGVAGEVMPEPMPEPEPDVSSLPKTGDHSAPGLWGALLCVSAAAWLCLKKKAA